LNTIKRSSYKKQPQGIQK